MPIPLKAGDTLRGRYRIRRIIGQGGMGSIYLTDDLRLEGRQCALKEVEHDKTLSGNLIKEARDQFLREATVLARLDHPNMPKVSDFFSIGQRDYLVMDFVPGKDLRTLMVETKEKGTFLSEGEVLNWSNQLSDALAYLHHQNPPIVHRDIKPGNLKLTPNGVLKLVDFGLVKVLAPGEITITILQGQGTALYTPLEQYGGDIGHTDVRSDIYAFGATLYHLLTGKAPADARQRFINPSILTPIRPQNPSVSTRTEKAIFWAMSLHPDDRPGSVDEFRDALIGSRPVTIPSGIRMQSKPRVLQNRAEIATLLGTVGVALLALVITLLRPTF
ncbi:MAG: serine/threonine protein kinase [Chloroflexi bacterium HGW-Chloroflexi-4]|jgi:serine/threonine-protein kinase|nr:MAG: serine/threonine protein kinase [Chloroflexi bacterium HGW-Chloroflexi-7]PKN97159.1 MAG: serine/threonine protein kinase [Chloroflexi bacterium HGW-Chloroflexi-4]